MTTKVPALSYTNYGEARVSLDQLISSRLLVQANSGGGKSRAIRQLLEETHGKVMHLVIDPEGEYATLREKFDYVLAAPKDGDVLATPKTARMLCRRLVELGASTVIDIYDLSLDDRREFVQLFLTELMALPRNLWRTMLVVIDEAHVFCPQTGEARSKDAVIALCTQGRKRGFCAALATQRIAKLHKDAAAELLNKLVGRTGLDVDVKRAGEELGFDKDERQALKSLAPGEFFAYGPAISNTVQKVQTGKVITSHPEPGRISPAPPPPRAAVQKVLQQLEGLQREAEEEERTIADLERRNRELGARVKQLERVGKTATAADTRPADQKTIDRAIAVAMREHASTVTALQKALDAAMKFIVNINTANFDVAGVDRAELEKAVTAAVDRATELIGKKLEERARTVRKLKQEAEQIVRTIEKVRGTSADVEVSVSVTKNEPFRVAASGNGHKPKPRSREPVDIGDGTLSSSHRKILNAIAELHAIGVDTPSRTQVALVAGLNLQGGHGGTKIGELVSQGLIETPEAGRVKLSDEGLAAADDVDTPESLGDLHERVLRKLPSTQVRILDHLLGMYPDAITRAELGDALNLNLQGGHGGTHIGKLVTLGVVSPAGPGKVRASDLLFPEGLK